MEANENTQTRPWTDKHGAILPDYKIREISKKWTAETWDQFLVETVERSSSYQREVLLWPFQYDAELETKAESIWDHLGTPETEETCKLVRKACRECLTAIQQQVIRGIFWQGFSERKIAQLTGVTRSTVVVQKKRALEKLKKYLMQELPQYAGDKKSSKTSDNDDLPESASTFRTLNEGVAYEKTLQKVSRNEDIKNAYEEEIGKIKFTSR